MIKLTKEKVLLLHKLIAEETGGSVGVRNEKLLDSTLESIYQSFDNKELYPTKQEKGARLGYSLISNHAFVDGNKRIGVHIMLTFLELNGIKINCTDDELVEIALSIASGNMDYDALLEWVKSHEDFSSPTNYEA
ncbi:MAG: type II toxin-antitoxin system death-on-curing family toxin [Eubacterium sp.]|nr:type II toxin-antitoxin system death-on-curing family toxin [Eubacterium sp.]